MAHPARRLAGVAAIAAAALPGVLPYQRLITTNAVSDTLALLPIWSLADLALPDRADRARRHARCIVAAAFFVSCRAASRSSCLALDLVYFAVSEKPIEGKHTRRRSARSSPGITQPTRLDRPGGRPRPGGGDDLVGDADPYAIWENEIFNRSCGRFYYLGSQLAGDLPEQKVTVDPESGVMRVDGKPVRRRYALADSSVELGGRSLAPGPAQGHDPVRDGRAAAAGLVGHGPLPARTRGRGATRTYTRLGCQGGRSRSSSRATPGSSRSRRR